MTRLAVIVNLIFILSSTADAASSSSRSAEKSTTEGSVSSSSSSSSRAGASSCSGDKPVVCGPDEEFSNCTQALCRRLNCSQKKYPVACAAVAEGSCESGCVCQYGLLRTANGTCVPESQCYGDLVCSDNEVVNSCPKKCINDFCPKSEGDNGRCCSEDQQESESCGEPVCICGFNYKRSNENGICIPTRSCPPFKCTGKNEEYNSCPPLCPTDDCSQASPTGRCPQIGRIGIVLECSPACRCITGYWRKNGVCVPYAECPGKCPINEKYSSCIQGECRALNCTQKGQPIACPDIAEGSCQKGCVCVEGTLRAANGSCVPEDKCPATCPKHEELSKCVQNLGRAQNCTQRNRPIAYSRVARKSCKKECVCVQGYLRDSSGKCIPENKCPVVCSANEEFSNCTQAICRHLNCSQQGQPLVCAAVAEGSCLSGCVCQSGYLKTANGICVPETQCYGDLVCKENEVVNNCPNSIIGDYCPKNEKEAKLSPKVLSEPCAKKPKCTCRFNYKRSKNGTCIPTRNCPAFKCHRKNEEYNSCPPLCPTDDCSQATPTGRCPLPGRIGIVQECRPACRCITGYWRKNGVCGPYAQCPGICSANERYSSCIQAECRALNCTQKGQPIACPRVAEGFCQKGCVCVEGTLRAADGSCVPEDKCPAICPANEEFSNCTQAICRHLNCSQQGQPLVCAAVAEGSCLSGCVCQSGYLRTESGTCVPENQCYPTCPANEEFSDCTQAICRHLNCSQQGLPLVCAAVAEGSCLSGCVCQSGYLRTDSGTCVPENQCYPITCPANEQFSNCTQGVCRAQDCAQRGQPVPCPGIAEGYCEQGCVCVEGTLRDPNGNCVPEHQCPAPTCGENEVVVDCPNACAPVDCPKSYKEEQERLSNCVSILSCAPSQCRCRPDYRRDENGRCIYVGECPGICPANEEFSNCTQAVCRAQNCTQSGQSIACPAVAEGSCESGCICMEGTLRNENGDCVPEKQCKAETCPLNEEYSECTQIVCRAQKCSQKGKPVPCPGIAEGSCKTGCVCKTGTLRDESGCCVPEDECPTTCPANEEFSNCTQAICRHLNCSQQGQPLVCAAVAEGSCLSGCVCQSGYLRTDSGNCVPENQCYPTCPANEEFSDCTQAICRHLNCSQQGLPLVCAAVAEGSCLSGCVCQSGYLRTDSGTCVPENQCYPITCPANEQFSNCTQGVCRAQDCAQRGQPVPCPGIAEGYCEQGCVCVEGTLRDPNGNCVPEHQCPAPTCGENEVVVDCPNACAPVDCPKSYKEEQERLANCVSILSCLPSQCRCRPNYRRDENGRCIFVGECPGICPANEEFSNCTQAVCRAQNCTQSGQSIACPAVAEGSCKSGCICMEGTLRNENGDCVPEKECKAETCPPNEEYSECTQIVCRAQKCSQKGKPVPCPGIAKGSCKTGCVCKTGTLRDESGCCVPEEQCPS